VAQKQWTRKCTIGGEPKKLGASAGTTAAAFTRWELLIASKGNRIPLARKQENALSKSVKLKGVGAVKTGQYNECLGGWKTKKTHVQDFEKPGRNGNGRGLQLSRKKKGERIFGRYVLWRVVLRGGGGDVSEKRKGHWLLTWRRNPKALSQNHATRAYDTKDRCTRGTGGNESSSRKERRQIMSSQKLPEQAWGGGGHRSLNSPATSGRVWH